MERFTATYLLLEPAGKAFMWSGICSLLYPFWMMIHCGFSDRSKRDRILWVLGMALFWGIGSHVYGLFASRSSLITLVTILLLVLLLAPIGIWWQFVDDVVSSIAHEASVVQFVGMTAQERQKLFEALQTLQTPKERWRPDRFISAVYLCYELVHRAQDGRITQGEFLAWMTQYRQRSKIPLRIFRKYIKIERFLQRPPRHERPQDINDVSGDKVRIFMNNGQRLEGWIAHETDHDITLHVNRSSSLVVPKSDIVSIER